MLLLSSKKKTRMIMRRLRLLRFHARIRIRVPRRGFRRRALARRGELFGSSIPLSFFFVRAWLTITSFRKSPELSSAIDRPHLASVLEQRVNALLTQSSHNVRFLLSFVLHFLLVDSEAYVSYFI